MKLSLLTERDAAQCWHQFEFHTVDQLRAGILAAPARTRPPPPQSLSERQLSALSAKRQRYERAAIYAAWTAHRMWSDDLWPCVWSDERDRWYSIHKPHNTHKLVFIRPSRINDAKLLILMEDARATIALARELAHFLGSFREIVEDAL
jgi:hypothetical protein